MKIGILGKSGAGKDTLADFLVAEKGFKKIAFAEPLYKVAREYYGMQEKSRELLQDIGNAMRSVRKDVFVNLLIKKISEMQAQGEKNIVVTDIRQKNEFLALKNLGFVFVYVDTLLQNRLNRIAKRDNIEITPEYVKRIEENVAETGCDDLVKENGLISLKICNDYSLESLRLSAIILAENYDLVKTIGEEKGEKIIVVENSSKKTVWKNKLSIVNLYKSKGVVDILEKDNKIPYIRKITTKEIKGE